ncbi:MAG: tyrosine-type recombinase/integrase [Aquincola sp.]|nr:tyrosine-type recombinase/integrase [Aquincola sp.]|tara:strand:- start:1285 stop:2460 length:1176 start_codon:yes stop_codon:yes gene_type:complete
MPKGNQRGSIEEHRGKLRLRYYFEGKPMREPTGLADTPANRHTARCRLDERMHQMRCGFFDPRQVAPLAGRERLFCAYIDTYLLSLHALAPSSRTRYERILRNRWQPWLGHLPMRKIVRADIDEAMARSLAGKSENYRSSCVVVLKALFAHAEDAEAVAKNPCAKVRTPLPARPKLKKSDVWQPTEVPRVIAAAYEEGENEGRMIELAFTTGMRFGEVRALRWENVDLVHAQIHVVLTAAEDYAGGAPVGPPKTAKSRRTIDIGQRLLELLRAHWRANAGKSDWLFPNPDAPADQPGPLLYYQLYKLMRRITAKVGVYRSPHKTRHTFASTAVGSGTLNIYEASEILGSTHETTERFYLAWADEERRRRQAELLDSMYPDGQEGTGPGSKA